MHEPVSPTVRLRKLTRGLRRWRSGSGLRLEDVTSGLNWSKAKLSRFEKGDTIAGPSEVLALAAIYGIDDAERDEYVALAFQARKKGWWKRYDPNTLAANFEEYVGLESEASQVREFSSVLIPGLLQTEAYATALMNAWIPQADEAVAEDRTQLRTKRQARLHGSKPMRLKVVIQEAALRQQVGGEEVMREQLEHLASSAKLRNVSIRVLPFSAGAVPALGNPFILLSFPDDEDPDVPYSDYLTGCLYLEYPSEVESYNLSFEALEAKALSQKDTSAFIGRLAREV